MSQEYRPEIEGLRAIAILPILLFHIDTDLCPGGFVGVDIFFVISGYLITRVVLAQGESFNWTTFCLRRFFRLFPALLVTLAASLAAGWWVLGPHEYTRLAQSAVMALFGISNFYFLEAVDYFNASSLSHPLLHTWSLGVEGQFYLVWPALLLVTLRWGGQIWWTAGVMASLSILALAMVQPVHPDSVFYMMPFRLFEFALGASLVSVERQWLRLPDAVNALAAIIAAILFAIAFISLDGETAWPSIWTIVPCLATALLILASSRGAAKYILSQSIPRYFGRISYSLYLVHWPLIALYRSDAIADPEYAELAILGALSIALGVVLYVTVEKPFRPSRLQLGKIHATDRKLDAVIPQSAAAIVLGTTCVAFFAGVSAVLATNGFPSRLDRERVQFLDNGLTYAGDLCSSKRARCVFGDRDSARIVYVVGDSHALNLVYGLDQLFLESGIKGIAIYDHGCLFALGTTRFRNGVSDEQCRRNVLEAYSYLSGTRHPIILAGDYAGYRNQIGMSGAKAALRHEEGEYYEWLRQRLTESLSTLGAQTRTVIVFKQTYTTGVNLPKCLAQPGSRQMCTPLSLREVQQRYRAADQMVDDAVSGYAAAMVLDPKTIFCGRGRSACETQDAGGLFFRDTDHLTNAGSEFLINQTNDVLLGMIMSGIE